MKLGSFPTLTDSSSQLSSKRGRKSLLNQGGGSAKPLALTNFAHSTQNSLVPSNHMAIAGSQTVNAQK